MGPKFFCVQKQAMPGFGLVEVLVSLVILSFGLLAMASIQIQAMKLSAGSERATLAQILANDMSNRIRANPIEAVKATGSAYVSTPSNSILSCANLSSNTACSSAEMAQYDLNEWQTLLAEHLPNGQGIVCVDSSLSSGSPSRPNCDGLTGNLKRLVIKIWWDEYNATANQTTQSEFITQVQTWQ